MTAPRVLVLSGFGLNCEAETLKAFQMAGADGDIVHLNDLIAGEARFRHYQILAMPGGFSYGDDTGSGNAFARRMEHNLSERLWRFLERDRLAIGICNGCQILTALGAVAERGNIAVAPNHPARYQGRWVDLAITRSDSPWLYDMTHMHLPVAHGEGRFRFAEGAAPRIAIRYVRPDGHAADGVFPYNPNGAEEDTAALLSPSGRVLAMMPHPERALFFTQRDDWTRLKAEARRQRQPCPETGDGFKIFENAVRYFS